MGNLSAFMRSEFKQEEIVEIEGFDRFKDENGKPVKFKVKVLSFNKIQEIRKFHRIEKAAYDKNKNPIIADGKLVKEIIFDNEKAAENILVEALVYPNLKDKELMKFYEVEEICRTECLHKPNIQNCKKDLQLFCIWQLRKKTMLKK